MIRRNALKVGIESLLALLPLRVPAAPQAAGGGVINVRDFGALGDGADDDYPAIARALAAARKVGPLGSGVRGSIVFFPPGVYRVSRPLDCTLGQFNLVGSGAYQTVLRGATRGSGDAVIDFTGAAFSSVRGMLIDVVTDAGGMPTPRSSTVGILVARARGGGSVTAVNLSDVVVRLKSDPAANGGKGTVALYNFAAEEANYHNVWLRGDSALVVASDNEPAHWGYGLSSNYAEILRGSASMTAVSVTGHSTLVGLAGPALRLNGGAALQVDAFLGTEAASPPNGEFPHVRVYPYAIHCQGMWVDFRHSGSMEGYPGLLHVEGGPMIGLRLYTYMARSGTVPAIRLSGTATLVGSDLDVTPSAAARETVSYLVDDDYDPARNPRAPAKLVQGCHIKLRNQQLRLRSPGSAILGNVIQSDEPLAVARTRVSAPGQVAGNVITARDGVEANGVSLARSGGWGLPTGRADRRPFDTSTATTEQLAERLKALIDDLAAKGLLGA